MDARQFLAEFKHIASAPGGVQRLRQMIYNLAITGDLTRQLADDGDAELMLRDIESAKARLTEEKTFKRSPKLENQPLILPSNINLPNSWRWSRLVDIGEINPKNKAADDTLASFIPMSGVPQIHSGRLEAEQYPWGQIKRGFTHFADGDVVLAKITPCFENGKAAVITELTNGIGAGTTELHVV
jgi:type I restriction enzyme, S subunit